MPARTRQLTARSVVLSVLLGAHPAWATAGELLRLTEDFDLKESTVRVALTRLVSAGDLVRSVGLTASEYTILMHLSEASHHELRMADLAEATGLSASRTTRLVDDLHRCGPPASGAESASHVHLLHDRTSSRLDR